MLNLCFFIGLSAFGLSAGEITWQSESGVKGSWRDEQDSSTERLLAGARSLIALSWMGHSEVGAGVAGSTWSDSGQSSPDARVEFPGPGASERTPPSRCCSSIIFFKYLPCASMRNCSCLCTCCALWNYQLHEFSSYNASPTRLPPSTLLIEYALKMSFRWWW